MYCHCEFWLDPLPATIVACSVHDCLSQSHACTLTSICNRAALHSENICSHHNAACHTQGCFTSVLLTNCLCLYAVHDRSLAQVNSWVSALSFQVGSIVNLSLMYLLAPTVSSTAGKSMGLIQKLFSEQILQSWGAPTGHMFERGYPFASRIVNLGYKVSFSACMKTFRMKFIWFAADACTACSSSIWCFNEIC